MLLGAPGGSTFFKKWKTALESADLRAQARHGPRIVHPDNYGHAQGIGRQLRDTWEQGILYPSLRRPKGECLAALRTGIVRNCLYAAYLEYNWDGRAIDAVFGVSQLDLSGAGACPWRGGLMQTLALNLPLLRQGAANKRHCGIKLQAAPRS